MLRFRQVILVLAVFAVLCASAMIAPTQSQADEQRTWKIGVPPWIAFDLMLYAEAAGIFEKHGLKAELIRFDEASDVSQAVLRGDIDGGFTGLATMLINNQSDSPFEVVLITNVSAGSDGVLAREGIGGIAELRGKQIACRQKATNLLVLAEALELSGLRISDVEVVDVSNRTAEEMLRDEQIDAAVLWEPDLTRIANSIDGSIIYRTDLSESLVIDTLSVRPETWERHPNAVNAMREVWFELLEHMEQNPEMVFAIVGERLNEDPENLARAWAGVVPADRSYNDRLSGAHFLSVVDSITRLLEQQERTPVLARPLGVGREGV